MLSPSVWPGVVWQKSINVPNERATYLQDIWPFYPEYDDGCLLGNLSFLRIPSTSCGVMKCFCLVSWHCWRSRIIWWTKKNGPIAFRRKFLLLFAPAPQDMITSQNIECLKIRHYSHRTEVLCQSMSLLCLTIRFTLPSAPYDSVNLFCAYMRTLSTLTKLPSIR